MRRAEDKAKTRRREAMLSALADQLASAETPEVKQHYDRLLKLGLAEAEVRELMAAVLAVYLWHTIRQDDYTYADYLAALSKLPEIDWQGEEDTDHNERA